MSNQTGKKLFNRYSFAEIATAFTALWKYNEPKKAERLDLVQWEKLYQSIRQKDTKTFDCYIVVGWRWEGCYPKIGMNCAVFIRKDHRLLHTVAEHPSWAEILGMEIIVEEEVQITPRELAAGMLWEMTYYGIKEE